MNNPKTICPLNFVEVGGIKGEKYKTLYLHFGCITEKPYSKPLERNVVYIPIITLRHAMSHDFKWHLNKPWLSLIWLDDGDVIDAILLLAEKLYKSSSASILQFC